MEPGNFLIASSDGHGIYDKTGTKENPGKRTPKFKDGTYILENEFNAPVSQYFMEACQRCGMKTLDLSPGDSNVPLQDRIALANKMNATLVVDWHYNALQGDIWRTGEGGTDVHYYPGAEDSKTLAKCVYDYLMRGTYMKGRGIKASDFAILRETNMPAILIENGFMDIEREALLMRSKEFQIEQAEEACQGVCQYLGVTYIPRGKEDDYMKFPLPVGYLEFIDKPDDKRLIIHFDENMYIYMGVKNGDRGIWLVKDGEYVKLK